MSEKNQTIDDYSGRSSGGSDENISEKEIYIDTAIINALWHALFDILDKDGVRSIFSYADLPEFIDNVPSGGKIPLGVLKKTLKSIQDLLQGSSLILSEIGRKFSFYLDPMGTGFDEFISLLNEKIAIPLFSVKLESPNRAIVEIRKPSLNSHSLPIINKWMMFFYEGMIKEAVKKSIGGKIIVSLIDQKKSENKIMFSVESTKPLKI